ncbi:MAG TPA: bifunctional diguanylate cyclase/phosphodiesterase [Mycobacterium sp.]|nr:bifunctional diguanylate cyclase/phosphodiesterase [Mycobacterium sp.]
MSSNLDVVTSVATQLMEATASSAAQVSEQVLAKLVERLDVDVCFLRHNDHQAGVSRVVAEWPPRPHRPDPDPLAVAHFTSANPVFRMCESLKQPTVMQAKLPYYGYLSPAQETRVISSPSVAVAPLLSGGVTTGLLGFGKFRSKKWKPDEISMLEAIASLFAQLQARIAAEDKLRYLADHDDLTGLRNRRALVAHLSDRLAAGRPGPVAILYIDLDRLKAINDCLGHSAGDWFIKLFADRLRECSGNRSMVARLGGDEFVIVPDHAMTIDCALSLANRLLPMVCDRVVISGHTVTRTVSIGVAVGVPGRDDSADLLRRADEAVLAAKRGGGNQVVVSDDLSLKRLFRNEIQLHLHGDLDSEALLLHYLPEVDLRTGAIVAAEALVRWRHPTRGLLLPDSFIGVAESINLADELGQWVLRNACADFSGWRLRGVGQNATLRVNVSPLQLAGRGFVDTVAEAIEEFDIDAGSLCLEITERAVVHDIESTRRTLAELKEVGVQIAIDDFGTGYAVLSHLKSLPVDTLKIDAGFVRDLGTNANDLAIIRAIIGLAEAFNLQLVAEGVETPSAAVTLLQHGCQRAQGFLFSRPIPSDGMESLLSARWMPMPFLVDKDALADAAI